MFKKILTKYLLFWLTLACVLAYYWKNFGLPLNPFAGWKIGAEESFFRANSAEIYIALTMLMIGSLLPWEEIRAVARHWPKVLGGTCVQYLSMPLLAYLAGKFFGLSGPEFIGIMLVGCVPGAMASNMLTMIARGNVTYSVGLTTSATLLSPIVVPCTLYLVIGKFIDFDILEMSRTLLLTVVVPVVSGFLLARKFPLWNRFSQAFGEILANLVIILIIASAVAGNSGKVFPLHLIWPMLLVNFGGYAAGWMGGTILRIDRRMARALMVEVGMQNAGLGVMLANSYFPEQPAVALCCAMYTFGCMFTGILLVQCLRVWADRTERVV
ncbi:MAG: bile acid:sodium symporter family protein [Planctomycetia bacterium]|nr:bile acid:sodium symporter family protein [Planctomycetia bacterium]